MDLLEEEIDFPKCKTCLRGTLFTPLSCAFCGGPDCILSIFPVPELVDGTIKMKKVKQGHE